MLRKSLYLPKNRLAITIVYIKYCPGVNKNITRDRKQNPQDEQGSGSYLIHPKL